MYKSITRNKRKFLDQTRVTLYLTPPPRSNTSNANGMTNNVTVQNVALPPGSNIILTEEGHYVSDSNRPDITI